MYFWSYVLMDGMIPDIEKYRLSELLLQLVLTFKWG